MLDRAPRHAGQRSDCAVRATEEVREQDDVALRLVERPDGPCDLIVLDVDLGPYGLDLDRVLMGEIRIPAGHRPQGVAGLYLVVRDLPAAQRVGAPVQVAGLIPQAPLAEGVEGVLLVALKASLHGLHPLPGPERA